MSEVLARASAPPHRSTRQAAMALGVAATLASASLAGWWTRSRPTVHTTTVTMRPGAAPVNTADCPVDLTCTTARARPQATTALRSAFPGATIVDDWRVVGSDDRTYAETVRARTGDGAQISVMARCTAHGALVPDHSISATSPGEGALRAVIVAGASGCSVAVTVAAPRTAVVPWPAAVGLAHEPDLQLRT